MGTLKMTESEAARLLAYLDRWARPAGEEAEREHLHWRKRLTGAKS